MSIIAIVSGLISVAPTIAKWLGGSKAEDAAQKVADIATKITGLSDPKAATEKILIDPVFENEFRKQISAQEHDLNRLYLLDVQDARHMQVEVIKNGKTRVSREFIYWYAAFITVFACSYIAAITFISVPESSTRFADTALGFILGTMISAIIQFFYGASKPVKDDE
ncbi:hypothetical protein [Shewanella glacialipiscicola]|uniref:hypothetical protein n=1 Tax=Shewanella glacialipiscicola TaxID=614069 RepID=UPI003D7ADA8E